MSAPLLLVALVAMQTGSVAGQNSVARLFVAGDYILSRPLPSELPAEYEAVVARSKTADLSLLNLEIPFTEAESPDPDYPVHLKASPAIVATLARYGVDGVSVANNHTMNYGARGMSQTLETLRSAGIGAAGAGSSLVEARAPALLTAGGRRIALLSYLSHTLTRFEIAGNQSPGLAFVRAFEVPIRFGLLLQTRVSPVLEDIERMKEDIRRAREHADYVIVSIHFHWGRTQQAVVPEQQHFVVREAILAGADCLLGHGPHVLRPVEFFLEKPIFYSLGNFVYNLESASGHSPAMESVFGELALLPDGSVEVELTPIIIAHDGPQKGLPRLADESESRRILSRLSGLSAPYGTKMAVENGSVRISPDDE